MDSEILQKCIKAGKIAAQVRRETAARLEKPGASFLESLDFAEGRILKLGGQIAWAQMALNDVAAHFCPEEDDTQVSQEGDLIKVDIGVHIDGYIADNAMAVEVATKEYTDLIKAAQNALKSAIKLVRPGCQLWELGEAQYSEAEALGFTTVKNLSGHTITPYTVHGGVSIPAFNNKDKTELQEGWQVAIEPFVTNGQGMIREKGKATVFMVEAEKGVRSLYAKKILEQVKPQQGLPFTTRWLTRKLGKGSAVLGLRELQQSGIIHAYPPLAEVSGGMVSQFEHSMVVKDKPVVYTRHEEDGW
ncbi:TPA: type II methionyl aminopeptidase [Candidatus Woesearchaeota archaeon]|nr:type II methionyl aminopeptidase [Candidatus Woesearchaeota archaeon]HIG93680.1 type II methionyl aminopeptidase [Candidatus Woesearchaeota archaeon]HIH13020.1 type II methionyl aminopeptidase [Candidatus Woesearchaeota archaeon]